MNAPTHARNARRLQSEAPARSAHVSLRKLQTPAVRKSLAAATPTVLVQGNVKLPLANATPAEIATLTQRIMLGLTGNVYYDLPDLLAALTASWNGQSALTLQIQAVREELKALLAAQVNETNLGREILKSAARGCESADSSDEALVSVGWALRKAHRSPSTVLPAPVGVVVKSTLFPGTMASKWRRVDLFRLYEYQYAVPENSSTNPDWDLLPITSVPTSSATLPSATIGKALHFRVRAMGTKGPGPWSAPVSTLVL